MTRVTRVFVVALSLTAALAGREPAERQSTLCRLVASGTLSTLRRPDFSDYKARVQRFYEPANYGFAWIRSGEVTDQAKTLVEILKAADAKGLDSEDYDGSRWIDRLTQLRSESDRSRFDLALTISAMRYIADLHFGRADPGWFHSSADADDAVADPPAFLRRLVQAADVKALLEGIEPPFDGYRRTERALQRYMAMAREARDVSIELPPAGKKPIEPGDPYDAAARLAELLRRTGDLPNNAILPLASKTYAAPLVEAVKHFQVRHAIDPDGRIGKATLAQLNTPLSRRVHQLQFTLERWRWVPHRFPRPPIVVNVPEFELRALNDRFETKLEMKVIVGKAYRHQTPVFMANMNQVIFRPYWNVPMSIERAEIIPKLVRDYSYLTKNHYEMVTPHDQVAGDGAVKDSTLAALRSGKLRIRQTPGPENALGLVKFLFPNEHDVYLHSTPATALFSRSRRDFSHGCIRVEKPQQLAAWVLRDRPEWTPERIAGAMNGSKTIEQTLAKPIPVLIVYATAVVLENEEVRFFDDIYGQDARLEATLARRFTSAERGPHPRE